MPLAYLGQALARAAQQPRGTGGRAADSQQKLGATSLRRCHQRLCELLGPSRVRSGCLAALESFKYDIVDRTQSTWDAHNAAWCFLVLLIGDMSKTEMEEMQMVRGKNGAAEPRVPSRTTVGVPFSLARSSSALPRNLVARHVLSHKFRALGYGRRWTGNPSPMRRLKSWTARLGAL